MKIMNCALLQHAETTFISVWEQKYTQVDLISKNVYWNIPIRIEPFVDMLLFFTKMTFKKDFTSICRQTYCSQRLHQESKNLGAKCFILHPPTMFVTQMLHDYLVHSCYIGATWVPNKVHICADQGICREEGPANNWQSFSFLL